MKFLFAVVILTLVSCNQQNNLVDTLGSCDDSNITLKNGYIISDSLDIYSFKIPDSSWNPFRYFDGIENHLTVGDMSEGYYRVFNVNQKSYSEPWNWDEELKIVEQDFEVVKRGKTIFLNNETYYHIIRDTIDNYEFHTYYLTHLDKENLNHYTIGISVESGDDYESKICDFKPILNSFKIKD